MILTYLGNPKDLTKQELKDLINLNITNKGQLIIELLERNKANIKEFFKVKNND